MVETPSRRFPTPRIRCSIAWAARRNWAASSRRTTPAIPERTPGAAASGRGFVFQSCFCLHGGEARSVPSATKGLHKQNAGPQALAADYGQLLLVIQQVLLGVYDIKIVDEAPHVAARGDIHRAGGPNNTASLWRENTGREHP